jgi:hypothetical protein
VCIRLLEYPRTETVKHRRKTLLDKNHLLLQISSDQLTKLFFRKPQQVLPIIRDKMFDPLSASVRISAFSMASAFMVTPKKRTLNDLLRQSPPQNVLAHVE